MNKIRRRLAILLAATLVVSSGSISFAAELPEEAVEIVEGTLDEAGDIDVIDEAVDVQEEDSEEAVVEAGEEEGDEDALLSGEAEDYAELNAVGGTVSDPSADPTTWSTDPALARKTYLLYLPRITDYKDIETVSEDFIYNGKKIENGNRAVTWKNVWNQSGATISFNCIPVEGDYYVIYAYGIDNEFDGYNTNAYGDRTASVNNYFGMDLDNKPGGVYDGGNFSWFGKSGSGTANGKIVYDAAVIKWSSGSVAKKQRLFDVKDLKCQNAKFATASFNAIDGRWKKLENNAYNKKLKQPTFYPVFEVKKSYREADGTKVKSTKEDKKFLKRLNKKMKSSKVEFEIRRRPIAGTVSDNYYDSYGHYDNPDRFASLVGDDLDFTDSGKLKKATLQFRADVTTKYKALDPDDFGSTAAADSSSGSSDSSGATTAGTKTQSRGYYVTRKIVMKKLKNSDASRSDLSNAINSGSFKKKEKTDAWYTTKTIDGENTLVVYGANNMEGTAAFRKRKNKSIGAGYYNSDKDCFIMSEED